ncbi:MAG TPA: hypothetical protein VG097_20565, partial [Gemmata sp.]|nr:hypothetical protein [Gemmata sp.]
RVSIRTTGEQIAGNFNVDSCRFSSSAIAIAVLEIPVADVSSDCFGNHALDVYYSIVELNYS